MTEITIEIPESLDKIIPAFKKPFLLRVIRNLARTKIEEDQQQLEEAHKHIQDFENRYHTTFETFKKIFQVMLMFKLMRISSNGPFGWMYGICLMKK